jgi:hypothetical protein
MQEEKKGKSGNKRPAEVLENKKKEKQEERKHTANIDGKNITFVFSNPEPTLVQDLDSEKYPKKSQKKAQEEAQEKAPKKIGTKQRLCLGR